MRNYAPGAVEFRRGRLIAIAARNRLDRADGGEMTSFTFTFKDERSEDVFNMSIFPFSPAPGRRSTAVAMLNFIDRSCNAGWSIKSTCLAKPDHLPEGEEGDLFPPDFFKNMESLQLKLTHHYVGKDPYGQEATRAMLTGVSPWVSESFAQERRNAGQTFNSQFALSREYIEVRSSVFEVMPHRCMCCGDSAEDEGVSLTIDHVKPRKTHPVLALSPSNMQVLCVICNAAKGLEVLDYRTQKEIDILKQLEERLSA